VRRRLTKSNNNIVISGCLGGIAEYLNIDPTIVRVIYVFLSMFTGMFPGFFLYIALMVLMPSGGRGYHDYNQNRSENYGGQSKKYFYTNHTGQKRPRKEAEKLDPEDNSDDDWSDF